MHISIVLDTTSNAEYNIKYFLNNVYITGAR